MSGSGFNDHDKLAAAKELAASFKGPKAPKGKFSQGYSSKSTYDFDDVRSNSRMSSNSRLSSHTFNSAAQPERDPLWKDLSSAPVKAGSLMKSSVADFLNRADQGMNQPNAPTATGQQTRATFPNTRQDNPDHTQATHLPRGNRPRGANTPGQSGAAESFKSPQRPANMRALTPLSDSPILNPHAPATPRPETPASSVSSPKQSGKPNQIAGAFFSLIRKKEAEKEAAMKRNALSAERQNNF